MAERIEIPGIRGWLHRPEAEPRAAIGLAHGAGSNCDASLLRSVAEAFAERGFLALRYDLPYRQARPTGPPMGNAGPGDREGIRRVAAWLQEQAPGVALYLGGHSYGGRQTSMAVAETPDLANALLLLSYPLHPPKQPEKLRTEHFPKLRLPTLFVHGTKDEFGSVPELNQASEAIPGRSQVIGVDGAKHGIDPKYAHSIAEWFDTFTKEC